MVRDYVYSGEIVFPLLEHLFEVFFSLLENYIKKGLNKARFYWIFIIYCRDSIISVGVRNNVQDCTIRCLNQKNYNNYMYSFMTILAYILRYIGFFIANTTAYMNILTLKLPTNAQKSILTFQKKIILVLKK